eukprot:m.64168 g.64168  ORF g.64168 m.64168 type:complete len:354 (-) comp13995_c0_seq2:3290-4351(-)
MAHLTATVTALQQLPNEFPAIDRIHVSDMGSSERHTTASDCFRLLLELDTIQTRWELLMRHSDATLPMDVVFGAEDEQFQPSWPSHMSPSWSSNTYAQHALDLLRHLLTEYLHWHYARCQGHSSNRLRMLLTSYEEDQALAVLLPNQQTAIVRRPIICERIDGSAEDKDSTNPKPDATLRLELRLDGSDVVTATVQLKPALVVKDVPFPAPDFGACRVLSEYVSTAQQAIETYANTFKDRLVQRRKYITAFLSRYHSALLEYDVKDYAFIAFLFQHGGFYATLKIELPDNFPEGQPVFRFLSVYEDQDLTVLQQERVDYPYSPRWSGIEMAERAATFLPSAMLNFRALHKGQG